MHQLMKTQNKIIQEILCLTKNILVSLEDTFNRLTSLEYSSKSNQILCYNDWVKTLIDTIIVPEVGLNNWITMSNVLQEIYLEIIILLNFMLLPVKESFKWC